MIKVFHLTTASRHDYPLTDLEASKRWLAGGYEPVAEIDTDDLEIAWFHTNHIDKPWWEDSKVNLIKQSRSSMVGDVFERNGDLYRVRAAGFSEISAVVYALRLRDRKNSVEGSEMPVLAGGES